MKSRKFVIGDIHGGYKALVQVIERSGYDYTKDDLIFLGDYVDGWPDSAMVIQFIIDLKEKVKSQGRHRDSIICIEGNHDEYLKEFLLLGRVGEEWLKNGGNTTINSYSAFWELNKDVSVLDSHREFLNSLYEYYIDSENRGFVHAGCEDTGIKNTISYLRKWDRNMWKKALSGKVMKAHKELYIGHTSTTIYKCKKHYPEALLQEVGPVIYTPMNRQNIWNVDTGGGWDGKLTIMDIDTKEYWQSDFVEELYYKNE